MQFGNLTSADKALFKEAQNRRTYHNFCGTSADGWTNMRSRIEPNASAWTQGFGDIEDYVLSIETDRRVESLRGQGFIGIGRATLVLDNSDSTFYGANGSKFADNAVIKILMGYKSYVIPVFAGVIRRAYPGPRGDVVYLLCTDYMILFYDQWVEGSRGTNNTPQLVVEDFCNEIRIQSSIGTGLELDTTYDNTNFEVKSMLSALQNVQNSVFHVCLIDEEGTLQMYEREYVGYSSDRWGYDERNVLEIDPMAPGEVINYVWLEYEEGFFVRAIDQRSIDDNGRQMRTPRILIMNSEDISSKVHGRSERALSNDLEAFQITTAAATSSIDCLKLKIRQDGSASGNITIKLYDESASLPNTLLGTSQLYKSAYLDTEFVYETFYFTTPVPISPSTKYWVAVDTSSVSAGTVYLQVSRADATGLYAYDSSGWVAVNNIQPLHRIRASKMAQTVAEDMVRFYKDEKARVAIRCAVGVPQVQLLDDIYVDVRAQNTTISGRYTVERIQHSYTPTKFTTRHTMRQRSIENIEGADAGTQDTLQNFKLKSGATLGDSYKLGQLLLY